MTHDIYLKDQIRVDKPKYIFAIISIINFVNFYDFTSVFKTGGGTFRTYARIMYFVPRITYLNIVFIPPLPNS